LRGWEISYYARNHGAKIKQQHGTYHPASVSPSFFFSSMNTTCMTFSSVFFPAISTTRRNLIRELCIPTDRNGYYLSILFSSPSLSNCRFTLPVILWFVCSITCKFLRQLINELHFIIYRSLWAEYLTFPYQVLSSKNVLPYRLALLILRFAHGVARSRKS